MKKILKSCLITSVLFSSMATATNPVYGPYFGVLAGIAWPPNSDYIGTQIFFPGIVGDLKYKVAFSGGLQLGYKIRNFRLELEGNYLNSGLSKLQLGNFVIHNKNSNPIILKGSTSLLTGFVNGIYEFYSPDSTWDFFPYVGLGIGYSKFRSNVEIKTPNVQLLRVVDTESVAAGQVIAGLAYYMDDFTTAGLDYRYMTTGTIPVLNDQKFIVHSVNLVFNFAFGW